MPIGPIIDLHCDLLSYLQHGGGRTAEDFLAPCSIPYMRQGGVQLQTMAIFTETNPTSAVNGMAQYSIFKKLLLDYPEAFRKIEKKFLEDSSVVSVNFSIENASSICSEGCSLKEGFRRLDSMVKEGNRPLYISLTWNTENRFGGGAHAPSFGLKDDGEELLEWMSHNQVAIDFSHASDALAYDILDYIDNKGLDIRVMASHSNLRSVCDMARNLPDDLAQELIRRKGIIGINFVRYFVGERAESFFSWHIEKLISWGAGDQICLGADFFFSDDPDKPQEKLYFPGFSTAACYPQFFAMLQEELDLDDEQMEKIAYRNALAWIARD